MPDMTLVVLLGGTFVALSVVSIMQYGRSLKRSEAIQEVAAGQQARYDAQQERAAALLDRHEALLARAEELVRRLESRDGV
jgi:hypothetical protein